MWKLCWVGVSGWMENACGGCVHNYKVYIPFMKLSLLLQQILHRVMG